jgi:hypothetical protein
MIYCTGSVCSVDLSLVPNRIITRPDDQMEPIRREVFVNPKNEPLDPKNEPLDPKNTLNILSECTDPSCIYNRTVSRLRQMYEQIIIEHCHGRKGIVLMFYASYKLLQELTIVERVCYSVSEIHLVDSAYEDYKEFQQIFLYFVNQIHRLNPAIKIYFYPDLLFLRNDCKLAHKFDLIGGIDIDYVLKNLDYIEHRQQIKHTACYLLRTGGKMIMSQHFNDLVDIAQYKLNQEGLLVTNVIDDYVKKEFYDDYVNKYSNVIPKNLTYVAPNYTHHIHPISCVLI